jgi:ribonuclease BN (tRNA processing enzyme)
LERLFAGARVLLAEATLLDHGDRPFTERRSLTASDAGTLATAAGVEVLVLTHIWEERGYEATRVQAAEAFAGRIEVARPGVAITW